MVIILSYINMKFIAKKHIFTLAIAGLFYPITAAAFNISFEGVSHDVITLDGDISTGLNKIYVAYDTSEINSIRIGGASGRLKAEKYSNLGGGYAVEVPTAGSGLDYLINNPEGNMGYIISDGNSTEYFWLVNYTTHKFSINAVGEWPEQDCDNTRISTSGNGAAIHYYSIDGRQCELSRDIKVEFYTLAWNEENEEYQQFYSTKTISHLSNPITLTPPLYCKTPITITGDRFLQHWGMQKSIESAPIPPNGLECHTSAEQTNMPEDDSDGPGSNMVKMNADGLGGSAPAEIEFKAYVTDGVIHNEWQIASDSGFEYITNRYNEQELNYTFLEEGTYYIRYVGSNEDGSCETYGDTYTVSIGSAELRIPNAFSPNDDGVNDEWKVGYRSLLNFQCWIFDRYGNEIFRFDDPSLGWDGTYKGKKVKPGVYYYVIEATGADGQKFKKGGDINIIHYNLSGSGNESVGETPSE